MAAATALATELRLRTDDAIVIHNSNRLALRLLPCDVFARIALAGQEAAALEVELALRLAGTASPSRRCSRGLNRGSTNATASS
jgi:hypothetical protein